MSRLPTGRERRSRRRDAFGKWQWRRQLLQLALFAVTYTVGLHLLLLGGGDNDVGSGILSEDFVADGEGLLVGGDSLTLGDCLWVVASVLNFAYLVEESFDAIADPRGYFASGANVAGRGPKLAPRTLAVRPPSSLHWCPLSRARAAGRAARPLAMRAAGQTPR